MLLPATSDVMILKGDKNIVVNWIFYLIPFENLV